VATCASGTAGQIQWTGSALQYCNGTSWQAASNSIWSLSGSNVYYSGGSVGVGTATPQSLLQVYGGEAQVGSGGGSCTSSNAGAIRYLSGNGLQYCNGSSWTTVNTISNTAGNVGYFVLSKGTYTGSLGGLSGADSTCLTELTTNTGWMGYSTALAAGQLVSGNVHAFLCDASFCNIVYPNTTYYFANANNSTGGASFTTNSNGYGTGDNNAWTGSTFFSYTGYYWSGRGGANSTLWNDANNGQSCTSWTSTSSTGEAGRTDQTGATRFQYGNNNCSSSYPLICVVNPQQQVVTQGADVGWFVMTKTAFNSNLGGLSGANAKCLTELTSTNTGWMGYAAANANGQLTSSKVFAFLCDGTTCNNLNASTTYYYASAADVTAGGGSLTTDASGLGPNDSVSWSLANRFGASVLYPSGSPWWSGRASTSNTQWANSSDTNNCTAWTSSLGTVNGQAGNFAISTGTSVRWTNGAAACGATKELLCFVNP